MLKKIALAIGVISMLLALKGQEQPQFSPKIYRDNENKIYINKNLDIYLKITPSPTSKTKYTLKDEEGVVRKFRFAKEGLNIIYSPTAVNPKTKKVVKNQNVIFEVYADGTPPVSSIHHSISAYYMKKDTIFFGNDIKVWFKATDNLSGIESIYYAIDNQNYKKFEDTLLLNEEKFYNLKYFAVDNTGNVEKLKEVKFFITKKTPITNLIVEGPHINNIIHPDAKISLKPQNAFNLKSITKFYIDNSPEIIYTTPISLKNLEQGKHTLSYYTETIIMTRETVNEWEFYIDNTPPMIIDELIGEVYFIGGKIYTSANTKLQITAIDNKAGVKTVRYSFDNKNWIDYTEPIKLPREAKNTTIFVYAEDNVGNKITKNIESSLTGKTFLSEMDLTPPEISVLINEPKYIINDTVYISANTLISIKSNDSQSGVKSIEYQIDTAILDYSKPFTIKDFGLKNISIFAKDNVNNINSKEISVFVDTLGPEIYFHFSTLPKNQNKYIPETILYLAAQDKQTAVEQIQYKINNSQWLNYTQPIKFTQKGIYEIMIIATDKLKNKSFLTLKIEIQ